MNQYVGMKDIPDTIPEFSVFPYFVSAMVFLGIVIAFIGNRKLYLAWFALMLVLGSLAMYDFYLWEYDYGHNLKANAAIKFTDENGNPMSYQPPLLGAKTILNFRAISMPRSGTYLMALGMGLSLLAFVTAGREKSLRGGINPSYAGLTLLSFVLLSCEAKPHPINYGVDTCDFCRMAIVDRQHAAQLVTEKGRVYNYDAIECMMNDLNQWDRPAVKFYLVSDYTNPGRLTDARDAQYLISEAIPSPMGANLSAFNDRVSMEKLFDSVGGETLGWVELLKRFNTPD